MKFLIVNPWIYDSAAYDFWLKPLGLLYISEILKNLGHEVIFIDLLNRYDKELVKQKKVKDKYYGTGKFYNEVVEKPSILKNIPRDFKRYGLPIELFRQKLEKIKKNEKVEAILVGVTLTYWYYGGLKCIEVLREFFPETPIFFGGIYSTLYTEHAKNIFSCYNVSVFPGTGISPLKGVLNDLSLESEVLDKLDWFEKTDLTYELYDSDLPYVVLITSVGCSFKCSYCVTPKMWHFEYRSIDKIVDNIDFILKKRPYIKDIVFFDDAFLLREDIKDLLKALSAFEIRFHLPNGIHARRVDEEIAYLLKKANFKTIKLGYESYDYKTQKETGFKVSNRELERAILNLKKVGFSKDDISAYILINLPGQSKEKVIEAIDFCYSLGIRINLNEFTPIPGTVEFNKLVEEKYIFENIDPLLLNNTYIPYWANFTLNVDEINEVKNYARSKYFQ